MCKHLLTKSSKPSSVPVNSLSFFMMTHMREPMHLSINSESPQTNYSHAIISDARNSPSGRIWEAMSCWFLVNHCSPA